MRRTTTRRRPLRPPTDREPAILRAVARDGPDDLEERYRRWKEEEATGKKEEGGGQ